MNLYVETCGATKMLSLCISFHQSVSITFFLDNQLLELRLLTTTHVLTSRRLCNVTNQESCELFVFRCPIINTRIVYSQITTIS
jgi:hypothetical protein